MPFVMLKKDWPGTFSRTVRTRVRNRDVVERKTFSAGEPVELSPSEIESIRSDIGVALMPVEFDHKGRTRFITDDVEVETAEDQNSVAESVN